MASSRVGITCNLDISCNSAVCVRIPKMATKGEGNLDISAEYTLDKQVSGKHAMVFTHKDNRNMSIAHRYVGHYSRLKAE
jgi:hypothetical protein